MSVFKYLAIFCGSVAVTISGVGAYSYVVGDMTPMLERLLEVDAYLYLVTFGLVFAGSMSDLKTLEAQALGEEEEDRILD